MGEIAESEKYIEPATQTQRELAAIADKLATAAASTRNKEVAMVRSAVALDEDTVVASRIDDARNAWRELQSRVATPVGTVDARYLELQGLLDASTQATERWVEAQETLNAAAAATA